MAASAPPRIRPLAFVFLLGMGLLVAACGDAPVETRGGTPRSHLAGIDRDAPIEGKPGHYRKTLLTKTYPLRADVVNIMAAPFRIGRFRMGERVWITGWRSNTENADGSRAPDDIHCHTTLSDVAMIQDDGQLFMGAYTDGFTPVFELPEGFAIPVPAGQRLIFQPMFNNRRPEPRKARMRLEIDYVPDSERTRELRSLSAYTIRVSDEDMYWIEPRAQDTKTRVIEIPFEGRIHAIGGHVHPYGEYIELRRERDHEVLFTARLSKTEKLEDQRLSTYQSTKGFYVRRGELLRITAYYDNITDEKIDAMGGFFVLYDAEGKPDA